MTEQVLSVREKVEKLPQALREKISFEDEEPRYVPTPEDAIAKYFRYTMRHCNGGATVEAGKWLKSHCEAGGKLFITMAGAGSSFQMGITLGMLIRAGLVGGICITGANMEESLYRLVANQHYAYIRDYLELTRAEEKELSRAGLRRITDTFLPEEESVRVVLDPLLEEWRLAQRNLRRLLWHQYFFKLLRSGIKTDPTANAEECWLLQAMLHNVPIYVPGYEDSTMGNIFTWATYGGTHPFLSQHKLTEDGGPIDYRVVKPGIAYMHQLAEDYLDITKEHPLAFVQLGGGIAADFPICVVPHLKKDFLAELSYEEQERMIQPWAGFVEIHSSPMSFGSYSGAGFKEKITWDKFEPNGYGKQIFGDYTMVFPLLVALILGL